MRRREFMGAAASLALGTAGRATVADAAADASSVIDEGNAAAVAERLIEAYPRRRSLAMIGEACRQEFACRRRLPDAVAGFLRRLDLSSGEVGRMPLAAIRARIEIETARDFSEGRIVRVRGWLLGESETRLCTIAALRTI